MPARRKSSFFLFFFIFNKLSKVQKIHIHFLQAKGIFVSARKRNTTWLLF